jgi:sialic acid synthase SpsE
MRVRVKFANKWIGEPNKYFVVAEAGSNHNGNLKLGKKLIEVAKECGCDAVKFQAFKTENVVSRKAAKAQYQRDKSSGSSQFEMLKSLELSAQSHRALVEYAKKIGMTIFYSIFDKESLDMVDALGIEIFKLGSGELTNLPLVRYVAQKKKPAILSTGMATDDEISEAVNVFRQTGNMQLTLMHCSTGYPSRLEDAHLRRIKYLTQKFAVPCGNSDHTLGIIVSVIAAALGVLLIEKHFTLSKALSGPVHCMSMEPQEMREMCSIIRSIEGNPVGEDKLQEVLKNFNLRITDEELMRILGDTERILSPEEKNQRAWARRSLVAIKDINPEEPLTGENVAIKRPEEGILPKDYEKALGRKAKVFIPQETPIRWEMIE